MSMSLANLLRLSWTVSEGPFLVSLRADERGVVKLNETILLG